MYAIVNILGQQFKVEASRKIFVHRLSAEEGASVEFDKVLFKRWEKKVYEVYFQKNNRVFYITVDKENIYLLHSCRKQK